jgi:diguanylate cyclase (GGDEF)-like protein/PAS domain S-box-containing protein
MTHVLMVEDHEENRNLLKMLLEANSYRVTAAGDGQEALDAARRDPPDAIVSDVLLPKMDGFALCRHWMQDPGLQGIPFIFYSGTYVHPEDEQLGMALGAVRYLIKPLEAEVFLGELRAVLQQWAGRAAPAATSLLDDPTFHALRGSALERRVEDKMAQLEAANRRLQESEARFRSLTEMSSDFYWESDAEHRLTQRGSATKSGAQTVFRRPAQIGERRWDIPCLTPDEAGWQAHRAALDAHRSFRDFEFSRLGADGTECYLSISGDPVFDSSGAFTGYRGVGKDITRRVRDLDNLRRLNVAMNATADAIYLVDRTSMRFIYVNDTACRMQSRTREELLALGPDGVLSISRADLERVYDSIIAGGPGTEPLEMQRQRKDGSQVWVELRRRAQRLGEGWMIVTVVRDITERKRAERSMRDSEQNYRSLADSAPALIWASGTNKLCDYFNQPWLKFTGRTLEQELGNGWIEGVHPDDISQCMATYIAAFDRRESFSMEYRLRRHDGEFRWIRDDGCPRYDSNGEFIGYIGYVMDMTERRKAEDQIRRSNRLYAVLSGINTLIVRVQDRDELFREACRIAVEQGQFRMAWIGIVDRSAMTIVPVASAGADAGYTAFLEEVRERLSLLDHAPAGYGPPATAVREKQVVVVNDVAADPRIRHKQAHVDRGIGSLVSLPLLIEDEPVAVFSLHALEVGYFDETETKLLRELAADISFALDHIKKAQELDYLAYYDALTGLANRSLFLERVAQYMRSAATGGHKLALFLIDLERFKNINDSLGRPAGDALLRQVAEWLARNARDANLVARVGADHFAVAMPEVKQGADMVRFIEKSMKAFQEHPYRLNDAVFRISHKVGIALFPDDGADADTLFNNAEAALKKAKASGERYLFYAPKMTETVPGNLTLENQLRQALDKEEFVLHYQPKVNLASGKMTGAEALIRWNDPRTGLVPPSRFIPVLEETGLIYEVGRWALRKAVEDYLRWRAAGLLAVRIAVNVSPLQLRNRGFVAEIAQVIGVDALAPAGLELEITENLIMENVKHNIASLGDIRAMGVRIAIDDFGTGFSSLNYLAKLPLDTLKIDRSFMIEMTTAPTGLALVSTIINLAHSLKLGVVAEGVETEEQSRLLRLLNCDELQGYLFSKPVPAEIFERRYLVPPPKLSPN